MRSHSLRHQRATGDWVRALMLVVLAASFPIFSLMAANLGEAHPDQGLRAWLVVVGLAFLAATVLSVLVREPSRAALLVSGAIILFFSYGHLYDQLREVALGGIQLGRHRFLLVAFTLSFAIWARWCLRVGEGGPVAVRVGLVACLAGLLMPGIRFAQYAWPVNAAIGPIEGAPGNFVVQGEPPNVYYVVLDGYGRSDILREFFGFDNSEFIDGLRARGFFVADASAANYSQTKLSLASSLGMTHLDHIAAELGPDSYNVRPLEELIWRGPVPTEFRQLGYQIVAFQSGYSMTSGRGADVYLEPDFGAVNEEAGVLRGLALNGFESMLVETTLLKGLLDLRVQQLVDIQDSTASISYRHHRARVLFAIGELSEVAGWKGQQFVFAHILSPHPPFVFGAYGEPMGEDRRFTFSDINCCTEQEYAEGYSQQVSFLSRLVLAEIDEILAVSLNPPIIILQGDHGPGSLLNHSDSEAAYRERMPILNAYFLPGESHELLYPSITPVNSFKVVFNQYFNADYALSEDRSFFSPIGRPYDFQPVDPALLAVTRK